WGLGCHERFLAGDGESWLEAARWVAGELRELQQRGGPQEGGWVHDFPYKHTYSLSPPWLSGMAQGEGASLLVRIYRAYGDDSYAEAAVSALAPMEKSVTGGGVAAVLGSGRLPEEYPTDPPSHVLNGAIFALWGCYDVAVGLGDPGAAQLSQEGIAALAGALGRYDTGWWSRYDLFPHPVLNVASPVYHRLHINQLRSMSLIDPDPRFRATAERFERYAEMRRNLARAYSLKVLFRLAVPRNRWLAYRLPWMRDRAR
ncbi:MAG TPA: D-glucuronyl C5-epimerase family protein, partial [Polyangia bacterium]|nr:D-glucuronyl C5-epimerase family protein [Polyangia bacterium]